MDSLPIFSICQRLAGSLHNADGAGRVACRVTASASEVSPGSIFVAVRGFQADGHAFVQEAFARGASICIVEDAASLCGRPGISVTSSRRALSSLAALVSGDPSARLKVVGITGTNGKTTTNWIVYHVMNRLGGGALRLGTLGGELLGRERFEGSLTSPDPVTIQATMARAAEAGAAGCVMEVSSHALDQFRVEDVAFDVGVFTNLTRDHLDYHKTFDAYFAAKRRLFELLARSSKRDKAAVINCDDPYGQKLRAEVISMGVRDLSFGHGEGVALRISGVRESAAAMEVSIGLREECSQITVSAPLIGQHNAENLVAAFAACVGLGYPAAEVASCLRDIPQVPGRLERVGQGDKRVFVDYAHTPDALERAIRAVRASTRGALWVVFGCGGDRDRGKRPLMAQAAADGADVVVVTSDNPRTEHPGSIIDDILSGGVAPGIVEPNRRAAIQRAIAESGPMDTVLIAGKGHEDYQIVGTEKRHFSDQEVAREALGRAKPASG